MKIHKIVFSVFGFILFAGSVPAFSSDAYNSLNSATQNAERAFHGAGVYSNSSKSNSPSARLDAGAPQDDEIAITATRKQSKFVKTAKKVAPYAFVAGIGIWMGLALAGGAILPALAVAAVVVLLFAAAK